jgi:hypothetical protein
MKRRAGRGTRSDAVPGWKQLQGTYQGHMGPKKKKQHIETNIIEHI